jgi:2,4-dienoyl-CoA reductase-like NADH-dependent reductase (Old Yellow Enzyme family)
MRRDHYRIFSEGRIGPLTLPNRLVRSATADPILETERRVLDEVLGLYGALAAGGVGLIITGDVPALPEATFEGTSVTRCNLTYDDVRIAGIGRLVDVVHDAAPRTKLIAQISATQRGFAPSAIPSPFSGRRPRPLMVEQIEALARGLAETVIGLKGEGFDGVQLHAAHGGLLCRFLSPYSNRRQDGYGGSAENRTRLFREVVERARERVGEFPILIKLNGTDFLEGGIDASSLPELAREIEGCGFDAIEISGGMWDCLLRSEEELGFRPVPAPESHTRISDPGKQSYFLPHAEKLDLTIPLILVGGNRDVDRLEEIVARGVAEFIAMCRPLISEPDLPNRWLEGRGRSDTDCVSCNSCIFDLRSRVSKGEPYLATCLVKDDRKRVKEAQRWLTAWEKRERRSRAPTCGGSGR